MADGKGPERQSRFDTDAGSERTNAFFVNFYRTVAGELKGLEAREHTAQVPYEQREQREKDFGSAKLPILVAVHIG